MDNLNLSTREELEQHYSPSRWSHRHAQDVVVGIHVKTMQEASDLAKATIECELGIQYGETDDEKLDMFGANTLPGEAPIFVYLHGGYWQNLSRDCSSFMALSLCKAGAVVVVIGYTLAPKASVDGIIGQVKRGLGFVMSLAQRRGSRGVYLGGASVGAHMASTMLAIDWMSECMLSPGLIKGALLVAGIYDIRPLVNTYVNDALKMTEEDAVRLSPLVSSLDAIGQFSQNRNILVAFGNHECPAFKKNSIDMNNGLLERKVNCTLLLVPNADHFNVIEDLQLDDYVLTKELLKMMGLNLGGLEDQMSATSVQ